MEQNFLEAEINEELPDIPNIDNWGEIATDIIKLKMNPVYKNIELDLDKFNTTEE